MFIENGAIANGIYRWSRHPSYAGFFYWAVATQLLLGNIASTLGFVMVLNKFFSARIVGKQLSSFPGICQLTGIQTRKSGSSSSLGAITWSTGSVLEPNFSFTFPSNFAIVDRQT